MKVRLHRRVVPLLRTLSRDDQQRVWATLASIEWQGTLPNHAKRLPFRPNVFSLKVGEDTRLIGAVQGNDVLIIDLFRGVPATYSSKVEAFIPQVAESLSEAEIKTLAAISQQTADPGSLAEELDDNHPGLADKLKALFIPTNPGETWTMVAALAAVAALILALSAASGDITVNNTYVDMSEYNTVVVECGEPIAPPESGASKTDSTDTLDP